MNAARLARPSDELNAEAGHRRDDDGHLVAGINIVSDASGYVLDALDIGYRSAAEFLNNSAHDLLEKIVGNTCQVQAPPSVLPVRQHCSIFYFFCDRVLSRWAQQQ